MGWISVRTEGPTSQELKQRLRDINAASDPDPQSDERPRSAVEKSIEAGADWADPRWPAAC